MKPLFAFAAAVLITLACSCPPSNIELRTTNLVRTVEYVSPLVVQVKTSHGHGSGVFIQHKRETLVLTCHHVIEDNPHEVFQVILNDGTSYSGSYVRGDRFYDLALIRVDDLLRTQRTITCSLDSLLIGENVLIFGYPIDCGFAVSSGVVSGVDKTAQVLDALYGGIKNYSGLVLTDAPVNPGNSGGPIVDITGRLIGIVQLSGGRSYDGIGLFVSMPLIQEFLHGEDHEGLDSNVLREGSGLPK